MTNDKFRLVKEDTRKVKGKTLYRIQALKDFGNVKKYDLGGYIQKEENLSHEDNCWVYDEACVLEDAVVKEDASVKNNAKVFGNAIVFGNSFVLLRAQIYGSAKIFGNANIAYDACVCSNAKVSGNAQVFGKSMITGYAEVGGGTIGGNAKIEDHALVENGNIFGNACICDEAVVDCRDASIYENAVIGGDVEILSICYICGDARITDKTQLITIKGVGPDHSCASFYICEENIIGVKCGQYSGTLNDFKKYIKSRTLLTKEDIKEYLDLCKWVQNKLNRSLEHE